jgi:isocitrate lyase
MSEDHSVARAWASSERWRGIDRPYSAKDVDRLRGSAQIEYTLARLGAERLWKLLHTEPSIPPRWQLSEAMRPFGKSRPESRPVAVSGWQVAANADKMFPDAGLYPWNSVPRVVRRINNVPQRADQIFSCEGRNQIYWLAPIGRMGS